MGNCSVQHRRKHFRSGAVSYLMDSIGGTHYAVLSHFQRYSTSTEYGVVREDGGDTDDTIGWSSGKVDTAAITSHIGVNTGWLKEWRNQVSGKPDVVQTANPTRQPQLQYDGGLDMYFPFYDPAVFTNMSTASESLFSDELDYYCVVRVDPAASMGSNHYIYDSYTNGANRQFGRTVSTALVSMDTPQSYAGMGATWTSIGLVQVTFRASTTAASCLIRKNNTALSMTAQAAITNTMGGLKVGGVAPAGTGNNWDGEILELIITSPQSSTDRDTIETTLMADYGL